MKLVSVQSSNIGQIGFEENYVMAIGATPINILHIVFISGNIFDYYGVDKKVFEEIIKAESIGKFFHANLKDIYK